jgi:hypothetical protein
MQAVLPANGGLVVPFVRKKLAPDGTVVDDATGAALRAMLAELAALVAEARARRDD